MCVAYWFYRNSFRTYFSRELQHFMRLRVYFWSKKSYFSKLSHSLRPRKCLRISILNIFSFLSPFPISLVPSLCFSVLLPFCAYRLFYFSLVFLISLSLFLLFIRFLFFPISVIFHLFRCSMLFPCGSHLALQFKGKFEAVTEPYDKKNTVGRFS